MSNSILFAAPLFPLLRNAIGRVFAAGAFAVLAIGAPAQAQSQAPPPGELASQASGHFESFGGYPANTVGMQLSYLPDGEILSYGQGYALQPWQSQRDQTATLRAHHRGSNFTAPDADPKWFNPVRHGWLRLPEAPECQRAARYLHTATVLAGNKVLIAGGLCDHPQMLDDNAPLPAYTSLSLWDGATHKWLPAPALTQARIYHSASLMPDGSVMLVGGTSDPGMGSGPDEPVLASVERYAAGRMSALPALAVARAKHSATVMADGAVLVVGGFDGQGRAMAAAELFEPSTQSWRTLPPAQCARYSHTATLLGDGRVLVAGGIGDDGRATACAEIWDGVRRQWSRTGDLPLPLYGHGAALLRSGQVLVAGGAWVAQYGQSIPWAWTWQPQSGQWELAGTAAPKSETDMSSPINVVARTDGSALVLAPTAVLRWRPASAASGPNTVPAWERAPASAVLSGRRVLFLGRLAGDVGTGRPAARIWDARSNGWSDAGSVPVGAWLNASALALRSGRVLYVGIDEADSMHCQLWSSSGGDWSDCGVVPLEYAHNWRLQPGLLPDGRAFVIANQHEVLVFDEARTSWQKWPAEWSTDGMAYGAPIRAARPLASIRDEASGTRYPINDAAARFMQATGGPTRYLWDEHAGQWAYIFQDHRIGRDARLLPDGCAVSTAPLAMFQTADASIQALSDPGFGVREGQSEMTVLDDGTLVVAGVSSGTQEAGSGFFHAKVSCAGFEARQDGDTYIAATVLLDETPQAAPKPAAPPPVQQTWWQRAADWLRQHKMVYLAVGAPLLVYLLLRRRKVERAEGWRGEAWRLVQRVVLYGALAAIAVPNLIALRNLSVIDEREDTSRKVTGVLPCRLIGVWSSRQNNVMRRIELKDDGTFVMAPSVLGVDPVGGYRGQWAVQGASLAWLSADGSGELDVNPMQEVGEGRFTLIEGNGSHTQYELIRAVTSRRCVQ